MSKLWFVAALLPLAACVSKSESDYNTEIGLGNLRDGVAITSHVDATGTHLDATLRARFSGLIKECLVLPAKTTATLDGVAVPISLGEYHWNDSDWGAHCDAIGVSLDGVTRGSLLVIDDGAQTWTIEAHDMIGADIVQDPADPTHFTWSNVTAIEAASVTRTRLDGTQAVDHITGNQFTAAGAPGAITSVLVNGHTTPTVCDGPKTCTVQLTASRTL